MTKPTTFTFFADPGHAWLKVDTAQLDRVGLTQDDFTTYSYVGDDCLYLEEDVDASRFLKVWEAQVGPVTFRDRFANGRSSIRNRPSIRRQEA